MQVQKYEDWMKPQIVELFNREYGIKDGSFETLFNQFYEHSFQKEKCIRIVSLDGKIVAGFQSFFYWPISMNGKLVLTYQSGNSLVHPGYRGKGIFAQLLNYIHDPAGNFAYDLLIGFPIKVSYNSLIRDKWINPFNLQWYIKLISPVRSLVSNPEKQLRSKLGERKTLSVPSTPDIFSVEQSEEYDNYRFAYQKGNHYRFSYSTNGESVFFELKAQTRNSYIKELMIGKMICSHPNQELICAALNELVKYVERSAYFTLISFAINEQSLILNTGVKSCGFRKIDKQIFFSCKGEFANQVKDWSNWWIFRGDIDTW
jgi:GNAT superfamily N-acetyltransferase